MLDLGTMEGRELAGRYRVAGRLGAGGMAVVFAGQDLRLDRPVAIKVLRPGLADDPGMRRRFEDEARSAARLSSPFVVAVFDSGDDGDVAFLVMERLPGATLGHRLAEGPLPPPAARAVAGDVLGALDAAHRLGLVHRDIKPSNILLTSDGRAKVADFGIAKSLDRGSADDPPADATLTGVVLGTPAYVAPERLAGRPATVQSDLYAVGVVMLAALTGRPAGSTTPADPRVPPAYAAVIGRAMAPDPGDRFASAADMARALGFGTDVAARSRAGLGATAAAGAGTFAGAGTGTAGGGAAAAGTGSVAGAGAGGAGAGRGAAPRAAGIDGPTVARGGTQAWNRPPPRDGRPPTSPGRRRALWWAAAATAAAVVSLVVGVVVVAESDSHGPATGGAATVADTGGPVAPDRTTTTAGSFTSTTGTTTSSTTTTPPTTTTTTAPAATTQPGPQPRGPAGHGPPGQQGNGAGQGNDD